MKVCRHESVLGLGGSQVEGSPVSLGFLTALGDRSEHESQWMDPPSMPPPPS